MAQKQIHSSTGKHTQGTGRQTKKTPVLGRIVDNAAMSITKSTKSETHNEHADRSLANVKYIPKRATLKWWAKPNTAR